MTWLRELGHRLQHLFKRRSLEQELAEKIESHVEIQRQEYIDRGLSPEKARRAAPLKLGNGTLVKEDSRAVWTVVWLESLWQDIRYSVRMLDTDRGFTVVAVLSLALGIGITTTMFSVLKGVLFYDLPYRGVDRLAAVQAPMGVVLEWRQTTRAFDQIELLYFVPLPESVPIRGRRRASARAKRQSRCLRGPWHRASPRTGVSYRGRLRNRGRH